MPSMPWRVTITAATTNDATSPIYFPDYMAQRPFNYGVGVAFQSTTAGVTSVTIQHSFDYTGSSVFLSSLATWINNGTALAGISSAADGTYTSPVSAIRAVSSTFQAGNNAYITIIQAG